jgi:hypothetical protein
MSARFMGNHIRNYDEHAEHSRRALFAKDRELNNLRGALSRIGSTFEFIQWVIRNEGRGDPAWTLGQVWEALSAIAPVDETIARARSRQADQFGTLDHRGHLTPDAEGHDMWTIAAWLPKGREAEVAEFLAEHGVEVYRMWQAADEKMRQ